MVHCLIVNGSLAGDTGNTAMVLARFQELMESKAGVTVDQLVLRQVSDPQVWHRRLADSDLIVVASGTYWDQWGSPLQDFLERMTPTEGSSLWLGKPTAVIVTMHSVGGKGIVSRLQGVLNTFGVLLPPMCGFVYSAVSHAVMATENEALKSDLWQLADLEVICHNLLAAHDKSFAWHAWPVDQRDFATRWLETLPPK